MCGSATLTTVPSRNATPDPSTVAMMTARPVRLRYATSPTRSSTPSPGRVVPVSGPHSAVAALAALAEGARDALQRGGELRRDHPDLRRVRCRDLRQGLQVL